MQMLVGQGLCSSYRPSPNKDTHMHACNVCMCVYTYTCLNVSMYVCMYACLSVPTHACLRGQAKKTHTHTQRHNLSVYLSICLSISIYPSIHLSINLSSFESANIIYAYIYTLYTYIYT